MSGGGDLYEGKDKLLNWNKRIELYILLRVVIKSAHL